MRFDGTLKTWNAERGFGFIASSQGGQDVFVHVTAFARSGRTPQVGEALSFEVETTADGKKRAVRVRRPGEPVERTSSASRSATHRPPRKSGGLLGRLVMLALVVSIGGYAYTRYERHALAPLPSSAPITVDVPNASSFRCDGRTYCSQMTSCSEAKYFLKNCPGVQMDGNNDGVPCEQQWCTSPLAK